jgi:CubicO group peptidase (beta-lactamase class C family)
MTRPPAAEPARAILEAAIDRHCFPAAVVEVGSAQGVCWRDAFGRLTFAADAAAATPGTIFDLASLTKPLVTTSLALHLAATRHLDLDLRLADASADWRGTDRDAVTVRDLLEHASGLPARLIDRAPRGRREFEHEIGAIALEYPPRTRSIYSDLGFILLGFIVEDRGGAPLADQFGERLATLGRAGAWTPDADTLLTFDVAPDDRDRTAPTRPLDEDERRGEWLIGRVHDNYAAALGGIAGHAGLFGTAAGVGAFARTLLRAAREQAAYEPPFTYPWVMKMIRRSTVPGSSRALGWDTMLPSSSCGTRLSFAAFGHVGYTGTSVWIDPILDRYFVLLTNRACGGGSLDEMREVRRAFHDAAVEIADE